MLPPIPGTRIHIGLLVAFGAIFVVYFPDPDGVGLRLQIMGGTTGGQALRRQLPRLIVTASWPRAS
jgi:hypothetical protein